MMFTVYKGAIKYQYRIEVSGHDSDQINDCLFRKRKYFEPAQHNRDGITSRVFINLG